MQETCNMCAWFEASHTSRIMYRGQGFSVFFPEIPMVSREDGGHLIMLPHRHHVDVSQFNGGEAREYIQIMMAVSRLMYQEIPALGIDLGRVNFHDNGNLEADKKIGAHQHLHFYGRARSARFQKWKDPLSFPAFDPENEYYKNATHFNPEEKQLLQSKLSKLVGEFAL